jgi:hypothetical protein
MNSRPTGLRSEEVGAFANKYLGRQGTFLKAQAKAIGRQGRLLKI